MNKMNILSIMLGLFAAVTIVMIFDKLTTNEIEIPSNIEYTVQYSEIAEFADLIVLATVASDIKDRKIDITYLGDSDTDIQQFRSFAEIKIDSVYKDIDSIQTTSSILTVVEPIVYLEKENTILRQEDYIELNSGQLFLLFLKKSPHGDYYSIIRDND